MEWQQFVQWALEGLIAVGVLRASSSIDSLKESVEELNQRVFTIIEKTHWHEKMLDKHEQELSKLRSERQN